MKGTSEERVAEALRRLPRVDAYKPPDDSRNAKPCDFLVWYMGTDEWAHSLWLEVKQERGASLRSDQIRPSQRAGVARAMRLAIPYWLVIWWATPGWWTSIRLDQTDDSALWRHAVPYAGTAWAGTARSALAIVTNAIMQSPYGGLKR